MPVMPTIRVRFWIENPIVPGLPHGAKKSADCSHHLLHDGSVIEIIKHGCDASDSHKWQFDVDQHSGDIFCFLLSDTGSGHTEVHVLCKASNYKEFIMHQPLNLEETNHEMWKFRVGPLRDIYCIKNNNTGAQKTEIHIATAASKYQDFSFRDGTALQETSGRPDSVEFLVDQASGDIVHLQKSNTGSKSTEIHVLSRDSGFKSFAVQTGTSLHETNEHWQFAITAQPRKICAFEHSEANGVLDAHEFIY